jgi:PAS domain S-box-containing protein
MAEGSDNTSGARAPKHHSIGAEPQETLERVLSLVNSAPIFIYLKDANYRYLFANGQFQAGSGKSIEDLFGATDDLFMPPDDVKKIRADEEQVLTTRTVLSYEEEVTTPNGRRHFATIKLPVYDATGALIGVGGFIMDNTERKEKEAEQQRLIAAQQAALREVSTPLLPIADGVLAMPLIGAVDSERARQIVDCLLRGIATHCAHTAIIDVTGIPTVDTEIAAAIVHAARAARLVGARVVLTGISPDVAQTLVELRSDLSNIKTLGTLASGIAFALHE